jgi:hypothetical protein
MFSKILAMKSICYDFNIPDEVIKMIMDYIKSNTLKSRINIQFCRGYEEMYEDLDDQCFGINGMYRGHDNIPEYVSTFYHILSGFGQDGFDTPNNELDKWMFDNHGWVDDDTDLMNELSDEIYDNVPWKLMKNDVDWDKVNGDWNDHRDEFHIKVITSYLDKKYRRTSYSTCLSDPIWFNQNVVTP